MSKHKRNNNNSKSNFSKVLFLIILTVFIYLFFAIYFISVKDNNESVLHNYGKSPPLISRFLNLGFIDKLSDVSLMTTDGMKRIYNRNEIQNDSSILINKNRIQISYAIYAPKSSDVDISIQVCVNNTEFFVKYGIIDHPNILYTFNLIGNTILPESLQMSIEKHQNIEIIHRPQYTVDLTAHAEVIKEYIKSADYFVLLNCGARGPYYPLQSDKQPLKPTTRWIEILIEKLSNNVKAVGPTINCEIFPHVQTYAIAIDKIAANIALKMWYDNPLYSNKTKLEIIALNEVGFSKELISLGYNIASLDPRHEGQDFRVSSPCDPEFSHLEPILLNPVSCRYSDLFPTPGCRGIDPCEVLFAKNGGEVSRLHLISNETLKRISAEDILIQQQNNPRMCTQDIFPIRPFWDTSSLLKNISLYNSNPIKLSVDTKTTDVIILRAHAEYVHNVLSFLYNLEAIDLSDRHIRVIIIPTEKGSGDVIINKVNLCFPISERRRIEISIIDVPNHIYDKYGRYINRLCTESWKHNVVASGLHSLNDVSRHCSVNSPLHYLLVDIILHYVTHSCSSCKRLVVTNADNFYSPNFFREMTSSSNSQYDVVMSNMVTRGYLLRVKAEKGKVDLGAYSVNIDFLKKSEVTFLNSLPIRPKANDYHDADGYFLVHLTNVNATVRIIEEYLFYHN